MEKSQPQILCAKEALDLLNCVTDPNFDQEKCIRLLNSLRNCVLQKINSKEVDLLLDQDGNLTCPFFHRLMRDQCSAILPKKVKKFTLDGTNRSDAATNVEEKQ